MKKVDFNGPANCMIYGEPGSGKTVLASTASKPLIIELDHGGEESLWNHPWSQSLRPLIPTKWSEVETIASEAKAGTLETYYKKFYKDFNGTFDTIILDSISGAREMDLREQRGDKDTGDQFIYNKNNIRVLDVCNDLCYSKYNVILIAHVKEDKDNNGSTILTRPDLSTGLTSSMIRHLSGVFYLSMRPGKPNPRRVLKVVPTSTSLVAKNRYGGLPDEIESPEWSVIEKSIAEWRIRAQAATEINKINPDPNSDSNGE